MDGGRLGMLLDGFGALDVLVVGDAFLDGWLEGRAPRLSREAPVPIVDVARRRATPGGAANTAANAAALGAHVRLVSVVGDDAAGARLLELLSARGVDVSGVGRVAGRATSHKQRVLADGQLLVRFDEGGGGALGAGDEAALLERLREGVGGADVILAADYREGVVGDAVLAALGALQRETPRLLVADGRDPCRWHGVGATVVTPNRGEALAALGLADGAPGAEPAARIAAAGDELLARTGAELAAVTLDRDGALVLERGRPAHRTYARPAHERSGVGAGDTFAAALALALAAGADTPTASELASLAAAVVVEQAQTAACSAAELRRRLSPAGAWVPELDRLAAQIEAERRRGRRIAVTNGVFDILHRGHVAYLNEAKALADVLVVALNSDASVARLKGPDRPLNALADRVEVLAALSCVDYITAFDDDRPVPLLDALRPDVYVKGGDYTEQTLPEAAQVRALGGEVRIVGYLEDRSTSRIVDRLRAARGAAPAAASGS